MSDVAASGSDAVLVRREGAVVTPETFVDVVLAVDKYYDVRMPKRRRRREAPATAAT